MLASAAPSERPAPLGILARHQTWDLVLVLCFAGLAVYFFSQIHAINHDNALYVQCAQALLEGEIPYVDFIDLNPPAIVYWNVPHVAVAELLGIDPRLTYYAFVWLLLAVSTALIVYLLRRVRPALLPAEVACFSLGWVLATFVSVHYNTIGQREHLFVISSVPFVFLRVVRREGVRIGWPLALFIGSMAGAGACLKPHFVVLLVLLEFFLLVLSKAWRSLADPECLSFAAVVGAYMVHWAFVPAAMREQFFGSLVPMVLHGYQAYSRPLTAVVEGSWRELVWAFGATVLAAIGLLMFERRRFFHLLFYSLLLAMVGSYAVYFSQHKGWNYHRLPFFLFATLVGALGYAQLVRHVTFQPTKPWIRGLIVAIPFVSGLAYAGWLLQQASTAMMAERKVSTLERTILEHTRPADRVAFLSTSVTPKYPMLLNLDRRSGTRYVCEFPIAFFYADVPRDTPANKLDYRAHCRAVPAEQDHLAELAEELRSLRPRLVLIRDEEECIGCPIHFNMFTYLRVMGIVKLMKELGYREIPLQDNWHGFVYGAAKDGLAGRQPTDGPRGCPSETLDKV